MGGSSNNGFRLADWASQSSSPLGTTPTTAAAGYPSFGFGSSLSSHGPRFMSSTCGSTVFGRAAISDEQRGSRIAPYATTADEKGASLEQPSGKLTSVSAIPIHGDKSHEELRWEDHQLGDKGGPCRASTVSAVGSSSMPGFESLDRPPFDASCTLAFSFGSTPLFGQPTFRFDVNAVGTTPFSCGTLSSLFEPLITASKFGSMGPRKLASSDQSGGSRMVAYAATVEVEGTISEQPAGKLMSVSAISIYRYKSHEELRWEDYQLGDKGGSNPSCMPNFGSGGPYGASNVSALGPQTVESTFGSAWFANPAFIDQHRGSRRTSYAATAEVGEPCCNQSAGKFQSISAMPIHRDKSHEELRWEDYQLTDKGGPYPASLLGPPTFCLSAINPFSGSTSSNSPKTPAFAASVGPSLIPPFSSLTCNASYTTNPLGTVSSTSAISSVFEAASHPKLGTSTSPPIVGALSSSAFRPSSSILSHASSGPSLIPKTPAVDASVGPSLNPPFSSSTSNASYTTNPLWTVSSTSTIPSVFEAASHPKFETSTSPPLVGALITSAFSSSSSILSHASVGRSLIRKTSAFDDSVGPSLIPPFSSSTSNASYTTNPLWTVSSTSTIPSVFEAASKFETSTSPPLVGALSSSAFLPSSSILSHASVGPSLIPKTSAFDASVGPSLIPPFSSSTSNASYTTNPLWTVSSTSTLPSVFEVASHPKFETTTSPPLVGALSSSAFWPSSSILSHASVGPSVIPKTPAFDASVGPSLIPPFSSSTSNASYTTKPLSAVSSTSTLPSVFEAASHPKFETTTSPPLVCALSSSAFWPSSSILSHASVGPSLIPKTSAFDASVGPSLIPPFSSSTSNASYTAKPLSTISSTSTLPSVFEASSHPKFETTTLPPLVGALSSSAFWPSSSILSHASVGPSLIPKTTAFDASVGPSLIPPFSSSTSNASYTIKPLPTVSSTSTLPSVFEAASHPKFETSNSPPLVSALSSSAFRPSSSILSPASASRTTPTFTSSWSPYSTQSTPLFLSAPLHGQTNATIGQTVSTLGQGTVPSLGQSNILGVTSTLSGQNLFLSTPPLHPTSNEVCFGQTTRSLTNPHPEQAAQTDGVTNVLGQGTFGQLFYYNKEEEPKSKDFLLNNEEEEPLQTLLRRKNPRELIVGPTEQWPTRSEERLSLLKDPSTSVHDKGNAGVSNIDEKQSSSFKPEDRSDMILDVDSIQKSNACTPFPGHKTNEAVTAHNHLPDVERLIPKLHHTDYYTEPTIRELTAKERAEPGFCRRVKDFLVGRHGHGCIKFSGETDVRGLDLESLVQFNNGEVIVYVDESKKPPAAGQGLNKAAEVTLFNIKCVDKRTGDRYMEGPRVNNYQNMLMKAAKNQGAEHVSYDPVRGEWKFRVQHFSKYFL